MQATEPQPLNVTAFKGLNNRIDPARLGFEWSVVAENVLCDDSGAYVVRPGLTSLASGYLDIYGTRNGRLLLVKSNNSLVERFTNGSEMILATGVIGAPFVWEELGNAIFMMSPLGKWALYPGSGLIRWGSLCPEIPSATYPLSDPPTFPPPTGEVICSRREQIIIGVWEPTRDRSVIYFSRPGFPHEFRLDKDYQIIAGRITLLISLASGLVIGTDRAIYVDPVDSPIQRVADYGVPMGSMARDDRGTAWFWSERGLCQALPFKNLTDEALVATLGQKVTAGVLPFQGSTYCVVSQSGGIAPHQVTQKYTPLSTTITHANGVTP